MTRAVVRVSSIVALVLLVAQAVVLPGCLDQVTTERSVVRGGVLDVGVVIHARATYRVDVTHTTDSEDGVEVARNDYRATIEVYIPDDADTVSRTNVDAQVLAKGTGQQMACNGLVVGNSGIRRSVTTGAEISGPSVALDPSLSVADNVVLDPSLVGFGGLAPGDPGGIGGIFNPEDQIRAWVDQALVDLQGNLLFIPMFVALHISASRSVWSLGEWDIQIPLLLHVPAPDKRGDVVRDIPISIYLPIRQISEVIDVTATGSQNTGWAYSSTGDYTLGWETCGWHYPALNWIYDQIRTLTDGIPDAVMDSWFGQASPYSTAERGYRIV